MDKRYLIFVSSTFRDLKEERRKVMEQILNMGHFPVGMELFQASNKDQWKYIEQRIKDCDYYLLIVGERYGSVADDNLSYTEKEFDLALASGVPSSAHLISPEARQTIGRDKVENGKELEINAFRKKCEDGRIVKYWGNESELALNVTNALNEQFREEPRVGLVRGDQIISVQVANEIARLSGENEHLRAEIQKLNTKADPEVDQLVAKLASTLVSDYFDPVDREYLVPTKNLHEVILALVRKFGVRSSKNNFEVLVGEVTIIETQLPREFNRLDPFGDTTHPFVYRKSDSQVRVIQALLVAGIFKIELSQLKEGGVRTDYELTELGKKYLRKSSGVAGMIDIGKVSGEDN